MKRRLVKWICGSIVVAICVLVAADFISARYLRRKSQGYVEEIKGVRQRESAYRRPLVSGEPLEQNAAVWYRQAFPHLSTLRGDEEARRALREVVNAGVRGYSASGAVVRDRCVEARSVRVQNALRSTRCDWELGFGFDDLSSFDHNREALMLAACLTVEGHRAHDGDRIAAIRAYLETVAVGCDLGMGNDTMSLAGMSSAVTGLLAVAKLVTTVDDPNFLDEVTRQLAKFDKRLPDVRLALHRIRLWLENAVSLDELANKGEGFRGLARIVPFRTRAAWRLWREDTLLSDFARASAITTREEGLAWAEALKGRADRSRNETVRGMDVGREASFVVSTFHVVSVYRALQVAIELQKWHIANHGYASDASALSAPLNSSGLRYEATGDRRGYKLIGPDGTILERPAE